VQVAIKKSTGKEYAVKIVPKEAFIDHPTLRREVQILKTLNHPNIVTLVNVFVQDHDSIQIVMEKGGTELFDLILKKRRFEEAEAKFVVYSLLSAVKYLHDRNICHRDIKPENILCQTDQSGAICQVKLVDFGMAKNFENSIQMTSPFVGTLGYKAPEQFLIPLGYTLAVDLWSLGVITYILLCGYPPFRSKEYEDVNSSIYLPFWLHFNDTDFHLINSIRHGVVKFNEDDWKDVSGNAKQLIQELLRVDPHKRATAESALDNQWFSNIKNDASSKRILESIKSRPSESSLKDKNILKGNFTPYVSPYFQKMQNEYLKASYKDKLNQCLRNSLASRNIEKQ
jgi:serine/threonine protein kinase